MKHENIMKFLPKHFTKKWMPVFRHEMRQKQSIRANLVHKFDFIGSRVALKSGLIFCLLLQIATVNANAAESFRLERAEFPASGRQVTELEIFETRRFSIQVTSGAGVALELDDQLLGQRAVSGQAGVTDGRIDRLLSPGKYRLGMVAPQNGTGKMTLSISEFTIVSPDVSLSNDGVVQETSLNDFQEMQIPVTIAPDGSAFFEAAGRSLSAMQLTRPDGIPVPLEKTEKRLILNDGEPLRSVTLTGKIPPGDYLLVLSAGKPEIWPNGKPNMPLYLRQGFTQGYANLRDKINLGAFGKIWLRLPSDVGRVEIMTRAGAAVQMRAQRFDVGNLFAEDGQSVTINPKASLPVAALDLPETDSSEDSGSGSDWLVTLEGRPNLEVTLLTSMQNSENAVKGIVAVTSLEAATDAPPVPMLFNAPEASGSASATGIIGLSDAAGFAIADNIIQDNAIILCAECHWSQRFNLLSPISLLVRVEASGIYRVNGNLRGLKSRFVLAESASSQEKLRVPDYESPDYGWNLAKGLYRLDITPRQDSLGLVELALRRDGLQDTKNAAPPSRILSLPTDSEYRIYTTGNVRFLNLGPVVNLSRPQSLQLQAGEVLTLPVSNAENGVTMRALNGTAPEWELKGNRLTLTNRNDFALDVVLRGQSSMSQPVATSPILPELRVAKPESLTFPAGQSQILATVIDADGYYRIQTGGLLALSLKLSDMSAESVAEAAENVAGRNATLVAYLTRGRYSLTITPQGRSAGDATLSLTRLTVLPETDARDRHAFQIQPNQVPLFHLKAKPNQPISITGLINAPRVRVMDKDGWPVQPASILQNDILPDGDYRLAITPEPRSMRVRMTTRKPVLSKDESPILQPDQIKSYPVPSSIAVTISQEGNYDITVDSDQDSRISLFDSQHRWVAQSDDVGMDWNPTITAFLKQGDYRLEINGDGTARVGLSLSAENPEISSASAPVIPGLEPETILLQPLQSRRVQLERSAAVTLLSATSTGDIRLDGTNQVACADGVAANVSGIQEVKIWSVDILPVSAALQVRSYRLLKQVPPAKDGLIKIPPGTAIEIPPARKLAWRGELYVFSEQGGVCPHAEQSLDFIALGDAPPSNMLLVNAGKEPAFIEILSQNAPSGQVSIGVIATSGTWVGRVKSCTGCMFEIAPESVPVMLRPSHSPSTNTHQVTLQQDETLDIRVQSGNQPVTFRLQKPDAKSNPTISRILATPMAVSFPSALPVVARLAQKGVVRSEILGRYRSLFVTAGVVEIGLETAGKDSIAPIWDKPQDFAPQMIPAGRAVLYQFTLDKAATIGVGIESNPETIAASLYDAAGKQWGAGINQLQPLPAGKYYLLVSAPTESIPVQVSPTLYGLEIPIADAPAEIRIQYQDHAGTQP